MNINKFVNNGNFVEINSHIDNNVLELIEKTDLKNVEWIQFYSIEPNENDIKVINNFFKKFPQIYLRWIEPSWIKYLPDLQKFMFDFTNENIEKIKNHNVLGLSFEHPLSKKDDLKVLYQFSETLQEIYLEGDIKNADEIISHFRKLKSLSLLSIKIENLNFWKE
jgi:hypothetical protein